MDGPADSSCALYDVTISVGYALPAATTGASIAPVFVSGVPYHTSRPSSSARAHEGGTYSVSQVGAATSRRCVWYASGLTTAAARAICRELRYLRGDQYGWDASGVSYPFGPGGGVSSFVRIPGWRVIAESNLTWGFEIDVVQEGSAEGNFAMAGYDGSDVVLMSGDTGWMTGVFA